ncbi:MAG: DUF5990 family protein [Gemmatimonadaceae bacterium]|jgi:hypothetical protein|nr:DUF5990 family protein [Gemmatimonadaceae bacterium]
MADIITLRVTIESPVPGVALALQRGRDSILPPVRQSTTAVTFDVDAEVRRRPDGTAVLAGAVVQGPPAARFLYITVGTRAGQPGSPWDRRAKVPLTGIEGALLEAVRARPGTVLAARIAGRAKDGGPACASVPLLGDGWQVEPRER